MYKKLLFLSLIIIGVSVFLPSIKLGSESIEFSAVGGWTGKVMLGLVLLSFFVLLLGKFIKDNFVFGALYSLVVLVPWIMGTMFVDTLQSRIPSTMVLIATFLIMIIIILVKNNDRPKKRLCIAYIFILIFAFFAQIGYLVVASEIRNTNLSGEFYFFYIEGVVVLAVELFFLIGGLKSMGKDVYLKAGGIGIVVISFWQYLTWQAESLSGGLSLSFTIDNADLGAYLNILGILGVLTAYIVLIFENTLKKNRVNLNK